MHTSKALELESSKRFSSAQRALRRCSACCRGRPAACRADAGRAEVVANGQQHDPGEKTSPAMRGMRVLAAVVSRSALAGQDARAALAMRHAVWAKRPSPDR